MRKGFSSQEIKKLKEFYGAKKCVVQGNTISAHWHHLDDDSSNSVFTNAVPLEAGFNVNLREARKAALKKERFEPKDALWPGQLLLTAKSHSTEWDNGSAYGCSRLACFIATNYLPSSAQSILECGYFSMLYARHRYDNELIFDTLQRSILPILRWSPAPSVNPKLLLLLLREVLSLYSEQWCFDEAKALEEPMRELLRKSKEYLESFEIAGILRRFAMTAGAIAMPLRMIDDLVKESQDASEGNLNFYVGGVLARCWPRLQSNQLEHCLDMTSEVMDKFRLKFSDIDDTLGTKHEADKLRLTAGNLAEIERLHGALILRLRDKKRHLLDGIRHLEASQRIFSKVRARPYTMLEGQWTEIERIISPEGRSMLLQIRSRETVISSQMRRTIDEVAKRLVQLANG